VLSATGRIGAPIFVELLLAEHRLDLRTLGRGAIILRRRGKFGCSSFAGRSFGSGFLGDRSLGLRVGQLTEIGKGFLVGHYAPTLFLRFIDATSRTCGFWPACGCSLAA